MKNKLLITLTLAIFAPQLLAANLTNKIIGVGPKNSEINPYFCIQNSNTGSITTVAPNQTVEANTASGNLYYVGGSLRFGGCDSSNSYLGYLGLNINNQHENSVTSYSSPQGVHIALTNPAVDAKGNLTGKINYTPINANFNILPTPPRSNPTWNFVGINLSGLEFGKSIDPFVIPNLSEEDQTSANSDLAETRAFLQAGMNTVRVPLSWGYLQLEGAGKGAINQDYYQSYVKPLLESLTSARVYTIVDLHAYMRYSVFGKEYSGCGMDGKCPDGTLITDPKVYEDIWTKLYAEIKSDSKINQDYLLLDLMNEPVDVPNEDVFTIQTQVIKALRNQGFAGNILIEGNSWTGLHSWTTTQWQSKDGKSTYSNATLFTRANFQKAGITDLSHIIINVHQYLDRDYSGTSDQCVTDLNTTGEAGYNLAAFTDYLKTNQLKAIVTEFGGGRDSGSCSSALNQFMQYLQTNSSKNNDYGFVGWTIWSTGHGWGDYNLRVKPNSYQMQILKNYL